MLLKGMRSASALTIAAVEGYCLAGEMGLAAGCEPVIAGGDAEFGLPEINVEMFPTQAMAVIMPAIQEK
jgi:enoyl-CoA hydratase/carnithine racemase